MITLAPHSPENESSRAAAPQARHSQEVSRRDANPEAGYGSRRTRSHPDSGDPAALPKPDRNARDSAGANETQPARSLNSPISQADARSKEAAQISAEADSDGSETDAGQQPFRAAWNHALAGEDISGVVSRMGKLAKSAGTPQEGKVGKSRFNTDGVSVLLPQQASETMPLALSVSVSAPPLANSSKSPAQNPNAPPPIDSESSPEPEAPATSNDSIAFTAHIHKSEEAAFEFSPGSGIPAPELQVIAPAAQGEPDGGKANGIAEAFQIPGARAEAAAAPADRISAAKLTASPHIEAPPLPPVATPPIRDIALHLPGPQNVELRVSDQSGQIRVDVRTADPALAQDLRGGLHELVSKLDAKGFTTAVSTPSENTVSSARTAASQDQPPGGGQQGGAQHHEQHAEQQKQRQSQNQEAWSKRNQDSWFNTISTNIEELSL